MATVARRAQAALPAPIRENHEATHSGDSTEDETDELDESRGPLEESGGTVSDEEQDHVDDAVREDILRFEQSFKNLAKRFRLINRIGEGTFSTVYKAEDLLYHRYKNDWDLDGDNETRDDLSPDQVRKPRFVAIKKIYVTSSPTRILNELELLHDLRESANVCPLITAFRVDDQVIAVLPFFQHKDFRDYYRELTVSDMRVYFHSLFTALRSVHDADIIHRDIKPTNFLYSPAQQRGVLVDFGLAEREGTDHHVCNCSYEPSDRQRKIAGSIHASMEAAARAAGQPLSRPTYPKDDPRSSRRANRAGTRGFRAPEVLLKCTAQTVLLDVWSCGVILLTFLSKRFPFFHSADDIDAFLELCTIFGKRRMKDVAILHGQVMQTNIPSISENGHSWEKIILWCTGRNKKDGNGVLSDEELEAIDFMKCCLELDPAHRISAEEALSHPWLSIDSELGSEGNELGEIAARILSTCRELGLETFAVYTENDVSHTYNAAYAIPLDTPASYMNVDAMIQIVKDNQIDAIHPGYGFLSESSQLASRMAEIDVMVIGPGAENLERTADKLQARLLAEESGVPVLPAFTNPTGKAEEVRAFAEKNGLPIMVKAVDGGGGRGIRLVRKMEDLNSLVTRAIEESPSKQVFAEKAAVDGFRHVEVQIIGDGKGNVMHLWERECSIQRRYQKIVELAPSMCSDREIVKPVIEAAMRIAKKVNYASLGTFEFLLNPLSKEFFFLEINPRLQVEHTITESICSTDLVKAQLLLAQGSSIQSIGLRDLSQDPLTPPHQFSIQLRLTAEDPEKNYSLSIGKIHSFKFPSGVGTRVDTALIPSAPAIITADFDSVIAKIIITARTWPDVVSKARRALADTSITGIKTNLSLLRAIVHHQDFESGKCDTQWLEANHTSLLTAARSLQPPKDPFHGLVKLDSDPSSALSNGSGGGTTIFKKDDAWTISLESKSQKNPQPHHLQLTKILQNDFPSSFSAEILYTTPSSSSSSSSTSQQDSQKPTPYKIHIQSTSATGSAMSSSHPRGDKSNSNHVIIPLSGKLVEVLVDTGDAVQKDEVVCVIKQMKMEVEVRSHKDGVVAWVTEAEDDEDVAEGMLAAVVEDAKRMEAKL